MNWRKWGIAGGVAVVVIVAGVLAWNRYWYYLPGLMEDIRNPVQANHAVAWQQGPAIAPANLPGGKRPPNIVFILADDLGYNDLSFNGGGVAGGVVPTPNINSIAAQGVTFTNGYAGNATCAPSRAAIMTGRYATRFGFEFTPTPKEFEKLVGTFHGNGLHKPIYHAEWEDQLPAVQDEQVPVNEVMIPKMLKSQGYHTLFLGKWHLGDTDTTRPEKRGFDEALGFMAGASRYAESSDPNIVESRQEFDPIDKFLWANLPFAVRYNGGHRFRPSEYMTDYLADEASKAIAANKNRPFFMYLTFNAVHTPLQALKSDYDALPMIKDHRLRVYAAMVRALDRGVGKVLAALKAQGLDDNTLVIFTSDNGGANYIGLPNINKPYRGWKASFFEGGIHVPFFMKWPGVLPVGAKYDAPVGHVDIYATAAAAAGAELPKDRVMDGVNLVPYVLRQVQGQPHQTLYWRSGPYKTLLDGDWKLQVSEHPKKIWLFNLKDDPTEKKNLADSNPQQVASLVTVLNGIDKQQHKPLWPSLFEGPIMIDHPLSYPDKPEDEYVMWAN
ncbi:MAG: sulfatase-like hydrolase/transferase [Proteobacteria bacterium]|nr:sulfatase-like hydrolase/transferase [Pseudomonadota bacterium]